MPNQDHMRAAMQCYVEAIDRADVEALMALFRDDATVDDPWGKPTLRGKEAIAAFFRKSFNGRTRLKLAGPIRTSYAGAAAMPLEAEQWNRTTHYRVDVIDVMHFADDGLIQTVHAYFGPGDIHATPLA
jgi:steroid delta-isomerase